MAVLLIFYLIIFVVPIISQYVLLVTTEKLVNRQLSLRRKLAAAGVMSLFFYASVFLMQQMNLGLTIFLLNLITVLLIMSAFSFKKINRDDQFILLIGASLSVVLYYFSTYLADIACYYLSIDQASLFLILSPIVTLLVQLSVIVIFKYRNPSELLQQLVANRVVEGLSIIVVILNLVTIAYSQIYVSEFTEKLTKQGISAELGNSFYYLTSIFLIDLIVSAMLIGLSSYILFQIRQRRLQENIVLQQTYYIQNLEKMQQDMRVMRHDYKNVFSGLVLQVQSGDLEGIKAFMETTVTHFDEQIGKTIQQTTHLSKVELVELKGLLLAKLVEMEKLNINCSLEILNPVKHIKMEMSDLLRCVGILLDNATEELVNCHSKELKVVISQEEQDVSIIVKNSVKEVPLLRQIWQEGYSTKGENRGLGLFSYQRIVDKYPNVLKETRCENCQFIQILKIRNGLS